MDFERHAFLLSLIDRLEEADVPTDRPHIHKTLFLLHEAASGPVPFEFVYRNGPYSYDIDAELSQMRSYAALRDLTSQKSEISPGGTTIFQADQNATMLRKNYTPEQATLQRLKLVSNFVGAVGKPPIELDRQATVAWIMQRESIRDIPAIVSRFQELKPNSSRENIEKAIALVNEWFDKAKKFEGDLNDNPTSAKAMLA